MKWSSYRSSYLGPSIALVLISSMAVAQIISPPSSVFSKITVNGTATINGADTLGTTLPFIVKNSTPATVFSIADNGNTAIGLIGSAASINGTAAIAGPDTSAATLPFVVRNSTPAIVLSMTDSGNGIFGLNASSVSTLNGSFTLPNLTTGTNADVVCVTSALTLVIQAAASCTISSMRFKHNIAPIAQNDSLAIIMGLKPVSFYRNGQENNPDPNARRQQVGLIAEDVAKVDRRLAIYEPDMKTVKSWHTDSIIAELVGAVQAQQHEIEELSKLLSERK